MQNVLIPHTALRLPAVGLALVFLMGASGALHARDYSLIEKLPAKVAAAKAQSAKGWNSGVTADMKEASYQYNKALVVLMKDLSAAYYEPDVLPPVAMPEMCKNASPRERGHLARIPLVCTFRACAQINGRKTL